MCSSSSSTELATGPARRNARIVAVGDELTCGSRIDTNSAELGRALTTWGYRTLGSRSVGDEIERIVAAIEEAVAEADVVLVTGGLGPTPDDRTREALAAWSGGALEEDPAVVDWLRELFRQFGRPMAESNRRQAMVPRGMRPILNPAGTAPALVGEREGTLLISLPGVPSEVRAFLGGEVGEVLRAGSGVAPLEVARLLTTGITESKLADLVGELPADPARLAFLPALGGVELVLSAPSAAVLEGARGALRERLGDLVYSEDGERLEEVVGRMLVDAGATVAVAESCTGGLALSRLTDVPGASRYVLEGVVTYSNEAKTRILGVEAETLKAEGAVSEAVARKMAEGVREISGASFGLASTGIAGPAGGTEEKPVGTVWIAIAGGDGTEARRVRIPGDRGVIKFRAAQALIDGLRRLLGRGRSP